MTFFMNCSVTKEKPPLISGWKQIGSLTALGNSGVAGPVTGVSNGVLVVGGGADFPEALPWAGGKKKYYKEVCIYELRGDSLVQSGKTFMLDSAIAYAANCSTEDGVVYAGGENETGISNRVFRLVWDASLSELRTERLPDLPLALTNAGMVAYNDQLIICGGETDAGTSAKCFSLNMSDAAGGWKVLATMPRAVSHMVLALQSVNGRDYIYILGGRCKKETGISDLYKDVYALDLHENTWEKRSSLPYPVTAGTGIGADKEHIVLFGGDTGETFHRSEVLSAAMKAEKDPGQLAKLDKERIELLNTHPGFSRRILIYNSSTGSCEQAGSLSFAAPATTTAIRWDNKVVIPGGEIRAGIRTPDIWSASIINAKQ
jgi:N-acetylneuraminic acid mutarotase